MQRLTRLIGFQRLSSSLLFCAFVLGGVVLAHRAIARYAIRWVQPTRPTVRLPNFVTLADRFAPSLVHIATVHAQGVGGDPEDQTKGTSSESQTAGGLGAGIIINRDGHILTNYHVVDHADKILVKLADRRAFEASVVGRDARSDIAVLKIAAHQALQPAPMGDSSRLETGEWVLAMGSPFGLERTVTAGIISATARRIPASVYYDYIQTDLAINPGNSGGPLLSLQGRVVGINAAMLSRNGASVGINFAIPINLVKDLLPELLVRGRVIRGWLGISTQVMSPAVARRLNFDKASGALVVAVAADGPAHRAGIHPGDIVIGYNGKAITEAGDLPALVAKTAVGGRVTLEFSRGRLLYQAILRVGELRDTRHPDSQAGAVPPSHRIISDNDAAESGAHFAIIDAGAGREKSSRRYETINQGAAIPTHGERPPARQLFF